MKKLILSSIIITGITLAASSSLYAEADVRQYFRQHDYQSEQHFIEPENKVKFDHSVLANNYFWEYYNKGLSNKESNNKMKLVKTFDNSAHTGTYFWGFYNNPDQY